MRLRFDLRLTIKQIGWLAALILLPWHIAYAAELKDILAHWNQSGFNFIYSSSIVRAGIHIDHPIAVTSLDELEERLNDAGFSLVKEGNGDLYVVESGVKQYAVRVIDRRSSRPLSNIEVTPAGGLSPHKYPSSEFVYSAKDARIVVNVRGYEPLKVTLLPESDNLVKLKRRLSLEEISVSASKYRLGKQGTLPFVISSEQLQASPSIGNDPLRSLSTLPGISNSGISAEPIVRGGNPGEIAYYYDGVRIENPFHLQVFQNAFSAVNTEIIDSATVYTGGFPVQYGSSISGVVDFSNALYSTDSSVELGVDIFQTTASIRQVGDSGSVTFAAREGNIDSSLHQVNPSLGEPDFYDVYLGIESGDSLARRGVGYLRFSDNASVADGDEAESSRARGIHRQDVLWFYREREREFNFNRLQLSLSRREENSTESTRDDRAAGSVGFLRKHNDVMHIRLSSESTGLLGDNAEYSLGGAIEQSSATYRRDIAVEKGALARAFSNTPNIRQYSQISPYSLNTEIFGSIKYGLFDALTVDVGARVDSVHFASEATRVHFSPQAQIEYLFTPEIVGRLFAGRNYQYRQVGNLTLEYENYEIQPSSKADQILLSLDYINQKETFSARVEAYNVVVQRPWLRFENAYNPLVLSQELAVDRVLIEPEFEYRQGVDMLLKVKPSETFSSWLTFSKTETRERVNSRWQHKKLVPDYSIKVGAEKVLGDFTFRAEGSWHSGIRSTALPATYRGDFTDLRYRLNGHTLPDYFSLDVRAQYQVEIARHDVSAFISLVNLTNRENIGALDYEANSVGGNLVTFDREDEQLFEVIPNIGIKWRYRFE
ncbi:MAG: hypothetical protein CMN85_16495 [Spongiibacteraceae bacterium]|nr:hypothetical protein [Spongiibacteraceae bacterium]